MRKSKPLFIWFLLLLITFFLWFNTFTLLVLNSTFTFLWSFIITIFILIFIIINLYYRKNIYSKVLVTIFCILLFSLWLFNKEYRYFSERFKSNICKISWGELFYHKWGSYCSKILSDSWKECTDTNQCLGGCVTIFKVEIWKEVVWRCTKFYGTNNLQEIKDWVAQQIYYIQD